MRWFGRWRLLARRSRVFALTPCVLLSHRAGEGEGAPLEGVGFLQARLPVEPPSKAFPLPCERDARAPSTRCAGNAGVPPAIPTTREKTYPSKEGAPPCAPTTLSHSVGEGLGVRAKKRKPLARGKLKRGTPIEEVRSRRPSRITQLSVLVLLLTIVGFALAREPLIVEAEGVAEWKPPYERATREAIRDALRQAIEQACGVRLARLEIGRDGMLERSAQLAFAQGVALRWQVLGEPRRQNGCVYVRVRAEVMPLERLQTPADWREVWQTVGHPPVRLVVRYTGEIALEGRARQSLQAALRQSLGEMGVRPTEQADPGAWQLIAELELEPITRWGDASAPYGLGDQFASWQARLQLLALAPNSRKPVLLAQRTAKATSLVSDADAAQRAITAALTQPDAHWRTTLATLWVEQILNRPDETLKNNSIQPQSATKEVANHAKTRTDRNRAATHRKPTRTRANRN